MWRKQKIIHNNIKGFPGILYDFMNKDLNVVLAQSL